MQDDSNASGASATSDTWRGYAQIAGIVLVLAVAFYFARAPRDRTSPGEDELAAAGAPVPVAEVVQPVPTAQALTLPLTGTVTLQETTTVRSEVPGRIVWVSPDFVGGGFVAAEETLVRIDPAAFELQVAEAQAAVEGAEARVWLEEAQGAENARVFALANPAEEPSDWVQRLPHLALAQAELAQAQAALAQAELQLARTHISLPYDVRVLTANATVGQLAASEETDQAPALGVVYPPEALQVRVPITPTDLAYLEPTVGRTARLQDGLGTWSGAVARESSVVNPGSRLATVFIEFGQEEAMTALPPPGTFVEVFLDGPVLADVYVLPPTVLEEAAGIWVVREGRLQAFQPDEYGWVPEGRVVQAFDAGEGIVVGPLSGAREGLEVSAQVAPAGQ